MKRQSVITQKKKRGPPATGKGELIGVRIQPQQLATLDVWIEQQDAPFSRPEAIRHLIDKGLAGTITVRKRSKNTAPKAAELAAREIDQLGDKTATGEERASRKRRLIKGPKEFRDMRSDHSAKPKS